MKITDISANRTQKLKNLSDKEAANIIGGVRKDEFVPLTRRKRDRGGPSDGCPPMIG